MKRSRPARGRKRNSKKLFSTLLTFFFPCFLNLRQSALPIFSPDLILLHEFPADCDKTKTIIKKVRHPYPTSKQNCLVVLLTSLLDLLILIEVNDETLRMNAIPTFTFLQTFLHPSFNINELIGRGRRQLQETCEVLEGGLVVGVESALV